MADTNHQSAAALTEGDGVSYSGIVWFVVILTVTTLVCQGLMYVLLKTFKYEAGTPQPSPIASAVTERQAPEGKVYPKMTAIGQPAGPQPQLLVNEPGNLAQFRAHEHDVLTTYGYEDKNAGVVRIPIERAKALILERGLPTRGKDAPAARDVKQVKDVKKLTGSRQNGGH